jgi:hypothetical protein
LQIDSFEIVRRAWVQVRRNRYLWVLGFFIALAGGGSQGFSLWVQSPILRGLTGLSPMHRAGERIADYARGNAALLVVFTALGVMIGLGVLLFGAFAQVSAIGAVAEVDMGREGDLRTSLRWGRHGFLRYLALEIGYLVVLAVFSFPLYILTWVSRGGNRLVFPCVAWLVLALGFLLVSVFAAIMLELSARYLVLEDLGVIESVRKAGILLRSHWKDAIMTWLYVMLIALAGTIAMALLLALLSTPLVWIFSAADRHHNVFLIALSMLSFLVAWVVAAALAGLFAITGSAVWTMTFLELEPGSYRK